MAGGDGGFKQMPSESPKCLQRASFPNCNYFNTVLRRLMQSHDAAVETALVLKLEILGHSEVFPLHLYKTPYPHCDKPSLGNPKDAMK